MKSRWVAMAAVHHYSLNGQAIAWYFTNIPVYSGIVITLLVSGSCAIATDDYRGANIV